MGAGRTTNLGKIKIGDSIQAKESELKVEGGRLFNLDNNLIFRLVCGPSECPAIIGRHLVRRITRISSQGNDRADHASGPFRDDVSGLQHDLHVCAFVDSGKVYEETVCQVHLPFCQLRLLFA